jgi:hypothetical protein
MSEYPYGPDRFRPLASGRDGTQWASFRGDDRDIPAIWDEAAQTWRILSAIPRSEAPIVMAAPPSYGDHAIVLPRSEWVEREPDPTWVPVLDQDGYNSCTGNAAVGSLMQSFALSGIAVPELSASYVYMHVNGGADNGAVLSDTLAILKSRGAPPSRTCPENLIYLRQKPPTADAEAMQYRCQRSLTCNSFDEFMSAIQIYGSCPFVVQVGNGFNSLDSEGYIPATRGPGNHAVRAYGTSRDRRGNWRARGRNSWNTTFGINGDFYMREEHFDSIGYQDCYCVMSVVIVPALLELPMPGSHPFLNEVRQQLATNMRRAEDAAGQLS